MGRQLTDDPGQYVARQRIASGLAQRLIVHRGNDHAARRRAIPGKEKSPIESQIFEPAEGPVAARHMLVAEKTAPQKTDHNEGKGQ